jgi:hypothetical protein
VSSDTTTTNIGSHPPPNPAVLVGAAFAGGLIVAQILKRIVP